MNSSKICINSTWNNFKLEQIEKTQPIGRMKKGRETDTENEENWSCAEKLNILDRDDMAFSGTDDIPSTAIVAYYVVIRRENKNKRENSILQSSSKYVLRI